MNSSNSAAAICKRTENEMVRPSQEVSELAFTGIHVISPRIFSMLTEEGVFSIVPAICVWRTGEKILAYHADEYYWRDLGKPENIRQAEQDIKDGLAGNSDVVSILRRSHATSVGCARG